MRDYSRELSEIDLQLASVGLAYSSLTEELEGLVYENEQLTKVISEQELALDSCRRIIRGLGHQSEGEL